MAQHCTYFGAAPVSLPDYIAAVNAQSLTKQHPSVEALHAAFADLLLNKESNDTAAEFIRRQIRAAVNDPEIAELLTPTNVVGCKRLCVDTGYYATYNRPNVHLVDTDGHPAVADSSRSISAASEASGLLIRQVLPSFSLTVFSS